MVMNQLAQKHFEFSNDHFSYWFIVVFTFFTITLFVVQDNLANKIQKLRKSMVVRCLISSVVRALVLSTRGPEFNSMMGLLICVVFENKINTVGYLKLVVFEIKQ